MKCSKNQTIESISQDKVLYFLLFSRDLCLTYARPISTLFNFIIFPFLLIFGSLFPREIILDSNLFLFFSLFLSSPISDSCRSYKVKDVFLHFSSFFLNPRFDALCGKGCSVGKKWWAFLRRPLFEFHKFKIVPKNKSSARNPRGKN